MKYVLLIALAGCYHMKNARFADESDRDPTAKVWVCAADENPSNPGGLMCVDLRALDLNSAPSSEKPTTSM